VLFCSVLIAVADDAASQPASGQAANWRAPASEIQYTVRNGDTLDRIISQHFAGAPFTVAFLRDALARHNPQSLPQGARGTLLAGTVMRIPDACHLRQVAFGDHGGCGSGSSAGSSISAQERAEIERRSWVRYP
jgi:Tfp pilus assembly protein FimV